MKRIDKKVKQFIRQYQLRVDCLDITKISKIIASQGYRIIRFNRFEEQSAVGQLLSTLGLMDMAAYKDAFTYIDQEHKLVFLIEGISDEDALTLLLHEEAHIYLDHLYLEGLEHTPVCHEEQANYFVLRIRQILHQTKIIQAVLHVFQFLMPVLLLVVLCVGLLVRTQSQLEIGNLTNLEGGICYWTDGGEVYHLYEDCNYILHSSVVHAGTPQQSMKDRCCSACQYRRMKSEGICP